MNPTRLLDALTQAEPAEWPMIYARESATLDIRLIASLDLPRNLLHWLSIRIDAGPPGRPLPAVEDARIKVADGTADASDIYVALMEPGLDPLDDALVLAAIEQALDVGSHALVSAVFLPVLAALLLRGEVQQVRATLDRLESRPDLDALETCTAMGRDLRPLLDLDIPSGEPALAAFLQRLASAAPPALEPPGGDYAAHGDMLPIIERLRELGATRLAEPAQRWLDLQIDATYLGHPLTHAVFEAIEDGRDHVAYEGGVPDGMSAWLTHRARPEVARLAGRWFAENEACAPGKSLALICHAPQPNDLALMRALINQLPPDDTLRALEPIVTDVADAVPHLSPELAGLVVLGALSRHEKQRLRAWWQLEPHNDELARLPLAPDGLVARMVQAQAGVIDSIAKQTATGRDALDRWLDALTREWRLAGEPDSPDLAQTNRWGEAHPPPSQLAAILFGLEQDRPPIPPVVEIAQCLLLYDAGWGDKETRQGVRALAWPASRLIGQHCWTRLFPKRLDMLDDLLEHEDDPGRAADLLYQRGITRCGLDLDGGLSDLDQAARLAQRIGHLDVAVRARTRWAEQMLGRIVRPEQDVGAQLIEARLVELLSDELSDELRGRVFCALARCAAASPEKPIERQLGCLDEAVRLLVDSPDRIGALCHRSLVLLHLGRLADARRDALEAFERCDPSTPILIRGRAHQAMAPTEVDDDGRPTAEAIAHGRKALEMLDRGGEGTAAIEGARIDLGRALAARGELTEASACFETAERRALVAGRLRTAGEARFHRARLAIRARDVEGAAELLGGLTRALSEGVGPQRLRRAHARLAALQGRWGDAESYLLDACTEEVTSPEQVETISAVYRARSLDAWPRPVTEVVLAWHRRCERPWGWSSEAGMLVELNRRGEALDLIRGIADDPDVDADECDIAIAMLRVLPFDDFAGRRPWLDIFGDRIDAMHVDPQTHVDLAGELRRHGRAGADPALLERARERAAHARTLGDRAATARAYEVEVAARIDELAIALPACTAAEVTPARWFLDAGIPRTTRRAALPVLVEVLLVPGPLVTDEALGIIEELIADEELEDTTVVRQRVEWLRAQQSGLVVGPPEGTPATPTDNTPEWIVAWATGRVADVAPAMIAAEAGGVAWLLRSRYDRTDDVLCYLAAALHQMSEDDAIHIRQLMSDAIDRSEDRGVALPAFTMLAIERRLPVDLQAAMDRRMHREAEHVDPGPATYTHGQQQIEHLRQQGVRLIERTYALEGAHRDDVAQQAAAHLDRAVALCRSRSAPRNMLFSCLVSAGNARKVGVPPRLDEAVALYREAEHVLTLIPADMEEGRAMLDKCMADVLLRRGTLNSSDGDIRESVRRCESALGVRKTGLTRAATLLTAAHAALRDPDRKLVTRRARATRYAIEAVELQAKHCVGAHDSVGLEDFTLYCLAQWCRSAGAAGGALRIARRLRRVRPDLEARIDEALGGLRAADSLGAAVVDQFVLTMHDPAMRAFVEGVSGLERDEGLAGTPDLSYFSEGERKAIRMRQCKARDNWRRPHAYRDAVRRINDAARNAPDAAGHLVAATCILAEWRRVERTIPLQAVVEAAHQAGRALAGLENCHTRQIMLYRLGYEFSPTDHLNDPVRDFRLASEFLQTALEIDPEINGLLTVEVLGGLARAYRYRTDGDIGSHRTRARTLFNQCIEHAQRHGSADHVRRARENLTELESEFGVIDRDERHDAEIAALRQMLAASPPHMEHDVRARLAWTMTERTFTMDNATALLQLKEAQDLFESCDRSLCERSPSLELNSTVCLSEIARRSGRSDEDIHLWHTFLSRTDRQREPMRWATAAHNLVIAMERDPSHLDRSRVGRMLTLGAAALDVRTIEISPRHAWETAWCMGSILLRLAWAQPELLPMMPHAAIAASVECKTQALKAARALGPGEELLVTCEGLARSVACAGILPIIVDRGAQICEALDEAVVAILTHEEAAATEARVLHKLLLAAAECHWRTPAGRRSAPWLNPQLVETIWPWWCRLMASAQRTRLGARQRPAKVSWTVWNAWRRALRSGDSAAIQSALHNIRRDEPSFLHPDATLDATEVWLRNRPSGLCLSLLTGERAHLLLAADVFEGERRVRIAALEGPPPPCDEATFAAAVARSDEDARDAEAKMAAWVNTTILDPTRADLGRPSHVLWAPTAALRQLPPLRLWPEAAITVAPSPQLGTHPPVSRPRRSLLLAADPYGDFGARFALYLRDIADALGPDHRMLAAQATTHGPALIAGAEADPASPAAAMRWLGEYDLVVLLAHGQSDGADDAHVLLVEADGTPAPLDLDRLSASESLAGASVILLSCETGRVGERLYRAGGVVGALLAAGAAVVVAPTRQVGLRASVELAERVITLHRSGGARLDEALAHALHNGQDVTLPFVAWTS